MNSRTQTITISGPVGQIQLSIDLPESLKQNPHTELRGLALIAHPHPLFGGTMDNKVVQTLARAFVQCGWTAVRFNFRGVGATEGAHDEGRGELKDLLSVIEQVAPAGEGAQPLALAGFSFGAIVTSHALATLWPQRSMTTCVTAVVRGSTSVKLVLRRKGQNIDVPLTRELIELHEKLLETLINGLLPQPAAG